MLSITLILHYSYKFFRLSSPIHFDNLQSKNFSLAYPYHRLNFLSDVVKLMHEISTIQQEIFAGANFRRIACQSLEEIFILRHHSQSQHHFAAYSKFCSSHFRSSQAIHKKILLHAKVSHYMVLVIPATNATSKHTFSALKHVKTYLRNSMKQSRLNHLMILHVREEVTDSLNLVGYADYFVGSS